MHNDVEGSHGANEERWERVGRTFDGVDVLEADEDIFGEGKTVKDDGQGLVRAIHEQQRAKMREWNGLGRGVPNSTGCPSTPPHREDDRHVQLARLLCAYSHENGMFYAQGDFGSSIVDPKGRMYRGSPGKIRVRRGRDNFFWVNGRSQSCFQNS